METIQKAIEHAEQHCKSNGSRLTNKRKHVLSSLLHAKKALSAYELIDICKNEFGESLPPMSMYRILNFLQDEHLVHRLDLANKYVACAHISCGYEHEAPQFLICKECQKVQEVMINRSIIAELQKNVENAGVHLASPQLEMSCICESCKVDVA